MQDEHAIGKVERPRDRFPQRDQCQEKAKQRGQSTFTLVEQDRSSPRIICEWIKENIETCSRAKLFEALSLAIEMREAPYRKTAD